MPNLCQICGESRRKRDLSASLGRAAHARFKQVEVGVLVDRARTDTLNVRDSRSGKGGGGSTVRNLNSYARMVHVRPYLVRVCVASPTRSVSGVVYGMVRYRLGTVSGGLGRVGGARRNGVAVNFNCAKLSLRRTFRARLWFISMKS